MRRAASWLSLRCCDVRSWGSERGGTANGFTRMTRMGLIEPDAEGAGTRLVGGGNLRVNGVALSVFSGETDAYQPPQPIKNHQLEVASTPFPSPDSIRLIRVIRVEQLAVTPRFPYRGRNNRKSSTTMTTPAAARSIGTSGRCFFCLRGAFPCSIVTARCASWVFLRLNESSS
jgi:hypothetical protein